MLASLLFPYDEDAPEKIGGWLRELESEQCIRLYECDNNTYLEITNWLKHQKIDHPTKSRLPPFRENFSKPRETLANPRASYLVPSTVVPSTKDHKKDAVEENPVFRVLDAMKVRNDPNWHGDGGRVRAWLADGADLERDILPTIERIMAKRNGQGPPRSLKYFDQAIVDAKATRLAPLPNGTPKGNGNGHSTGPVTKLFEGAARAIAKREAADRTTNHNPPKSLLDRR